MQVSNILESIDLGAVALPEFQRGYVWTRKQVRDFMLSLYRKRPVGSLLFWVTPSEAAPARGDAHLQQGHVKLILDGQQRITTLYGIIKGKPPQFFEGSPETFSRLMFHIDQEAFEFYAPITMKDDPLWINVTELMTRGLEPFIDRFGSNPGLYSAMARYLARLSAVHAIRERDFHIEEVAGEASSLDEVVEIFNNLNRGGTKLSKGDLALAKMCARWPEARAKMRGMIAGWSGAGYEFELDWLLRNVTTITTGQALFEGLEKVMAPQFREGLEAAERAINYILNVISGRLGLDHDRVLGGRYAIPVLTRYLSIRGGRLQDAAERDKLLYWYVHTFLWGRFAGSTETALNRDLRAIEEAEDGKEVDALIEQLSRWRSSLKIRPEDFSGWSLGSRFYPLLYLMTRMEEARDWGTGLPLKASMLGKLNRLDVHHIFPKAILYKNKFTKPQVNSLANFCFLTQDTNLDISDTPPERYFPEVEGKHPGALASQWIPMDEVLWRIKNYPEFLETRRELLARAAEKYVAGLLKTAAADIQEVSNQLRPSVQAVIGGIESSDEERILRDCNKWVTQRGLSQGQLAYEVVSDDGSLLALIDIAWPQGLQEGLTEPIAVLLDETDEVEDLVNRLGFRYFTKVADFYDYVTREILALADMA